MGLSETLESVYYPGISGLELRVIDEKARKILSENREKLDELAMYLYEKDIDQSIEMVRFQCGPDSRDACRINILFNRKELIYGR